MKDPVGEDGWLALVDEASRTASDLEQRIGVVELYKRAIAAEPWSNKLWLAYCEWVWSLYTDCQTADAGWPEEEQKLGQELFSLEMALDVWQQGAQATSFRLNDSHELWNRWVSIELERLANSPTRDSIEHVRNLFFARLQVPHAMWDETSQMFSAFITKYDEPSYESTMVRVTQLAKEAKDLYGEREDYETKLERARETGDIEAQKSIMKEYLEWEVTQSRRKPKRGAPSGPLILAIALYERALASTGLGLEASIWADYIAFLSTTLQRNPRAQIPSIISVVQRAVGHCPWSGYLWARYIISAEAESQTFSTIEQIKHAATSAGVLDRDGMSSVVEVYVAWCGYLRRRTMTKDATDEDVDIADVGLPAALESVEHWGQRLYGKDDYKGDPAFRIERIAIQHFTEQGSIGQAREYWKRLIKTHGDSYEFWYQYYIWEMTVRKPPTGSSVATEVLVQALDRRLDWPEKIMEVYIRHCNLYEDVHSLGRALDNVHIESKAVARRREREAAEAATLYAQQQAGTEEDQAQYVAGTPSGMSKRKRSETDNAAGGLAKKVKNGLVEPDSELQREQQLKRDRENTSIMVKNLAPEVTQTKLKQYFKEYGHINSLTIQTEKDNESSTAFIEFRSTEDVQSALLRDGKYMGDRQISVKPAAGLTIYVTNYPPASDETYIRKLFKECGEIFSIRWPSLKYNTHRRFCYVTFRTAEAAAAATRLDGTKLENKYQLVAKYSDPTRKKPREGAAEEAREVHVTGLDLTATEDDVCQIFSKYGKVESVRLLRNVGGRSKGAAFVDFETKEQATAALELDKTKFRNQLLKVELSSSVNFKPSATTIARKGSSESPAPEVNGNAAKSPLPDQQANSHSSNAPSREEIAKRTITLMNIPDTVNDARVRAIVEPHGSLVKLTLRHDHQGAIVEYADVTAAGRASLALEGYEIVPGRRLRVGGLKDLFEEKDEKRTDRIQSKRSLANFIQPPAPVRRPVGPGGRGGLGQKRGLGFAGNSASTATTASSSSATATATTAAATTKPGGASGTNNFGNGAEREKLAPKSNADFKAMFLGEKS
ncbi:hypothetical protein F5884DRAFT_850209 [Xylogone sp. PMI_703]|nr:hypothetical protein F5884DRAFT_850209 [Xylogone sp. PMI_703]